MLKESIPSKCAQLDEAEPITVLQWALGEFESSQIAFATSFGAEDQVVLDMLRSIDASVGVFTLDTWKLPPETYEVWKATEKRYGLAIEAITPDPKDVEDMIASYGDDLYYKSVELRKRCCGVRKVAPLKKKLSKLAAWITGQRREQSVTRSQLQKIEWDDSFGLVKLNPLADWGQEQVWAYIKQNNLPYNSLHDRGYPSVGCAPCTRAIKPGEDIRAGRWWWENANSKECGLHQKQAGSL